MVLAPRGGQPGLPDVLPVGTPRTASTQCLRTGLLGTPPGRADEDALVLSLLRDSLDSGTSSRIHGGRSNLREQVHQRRNRLGVQLLHGTDELAPEILIRKPFA